MTVFKGDNYTGQYVTKPAAKYPKGEIAGRKRVILERITLASDIADGDTIIVGKLPANSVVTDAYLLGRKSLGATGIFDLGLAATEDEEGNVIAEDLDGLVNDCDLGGQGALKRAGLNALIGVRIGKETNILVDCTEAGDDSVNDCELIVMVEYVSD